MISVEVNRSFRVRALAQLDLPFGAPEAWRSLRDFRRFACQDVFHRSLELDRPEPQAGAKFLLVHALAGIRIVRVGRILYWREGESYAFSDLSRRGKGRGFPHIYVYRLEPLDDERSRFQIGVCGRWTARFLGRPAVRVWLSWVLLKTATSIHNELVRDAIARRAGTPVGEAAR